MCSLVLRQQHIDVSRFDDIKLRQRVKRFCKNIWPRRVRAPARFNIEFATDSAVFSANVRVEAASTPRSTNLNNHVLHA
jgi:hypothetical protein